MICSYDNCTDLASPEEYTGIRICKEHLDQLNELANDNEVKDMFRCDKRRIFIEFEREQHAFKQKAIELGGLDEDDIKELIFYVMGGGKGYNPKVNRESLFWKLHKEKIQERELRIIAQRNGLEEEFLARQLAANIMMSRSGKNKKKMLLKKLKKLEFPETSRKRKNSSCMDNEIKKIKKLKN
jgi:hypothetical protein